MRLVLDDPRPYSSHCDHVVSGETCFVLPYGMNKPIETPARPKLHAQAQRKRDWRLSYRSPEGYSASTLRRRLFIHSISRIIQSDFAKRSYFWIEQSILVSF